MKTNESYNFELTFNIENSQHKQNIDLEILVEKLYEAGLSDTTLALGQEGCITCVGTRCNNNVIEVYRSVINDFKKVIPYAMVVANKDDNFWDYENDDTPLKEHSSIYGTTSLAGSGMSFAMNNMLDSIIRKSRSLGTIMYIDRGKSYGDFYDEQQKYFMEDNIIHLQKKENINQFKQRVQKKLVEKDQLKYNMKYFASREFNKEIQKAFSIKKYYIS